MKKRPAQNVVGPQIRRLRVRAGLTQDAVAAKCGVAGWDVSRGTLAKIEAQVRCVSDVELFVLARVMKVEVGALYPDAAAVVAMVRGKVR
jgi:transcriptional regulator with XRE-family HTH domain